ncbi:MAG: hypothetical protein K2M85_07455 [Paramuribaculum sp.]|nr:hypothetical protein [Paramuribaculum sp.]
MTNGNVLWFTGIDNMLSSRPEAEPSGVISLIEDRTRRSLRNSFEELTDRIASSLLKTSRTAEVIITDFGLLITDKDKKTAVITSSGYRPEDMMRDIEERGVGQVIFLRNRLVCTRQKYVDAAISCGFSFFRQPMPSAIYSSRQTYFIPDDNTFLPSDTPTNFYAFTQNVQGNKNTVVGGNNITGNTITGNNGPVIMGNNGPINITQPQKKSWKDYVGDLVVGVLSGVLSNGGCAFFSTLCGS